MPTKSRRKNTSVIQQLAEAPYAYTFFQAVRLLERAAAFEEQEKTGLRSRGLNTDFATNPVARYTPPSSEVVRFSAKQTLKFNESEILSLEKKKHSDKPDQWLMEVGFIGLTGSQGVLPYHYTEMILQRLKQKDESLMHFLDLFNHRSISLFYQASTKYFLPLEYERKKLNPPPETGSDSQTLALLSLIGLGTRHLQNRMEISDETLIFFGGLFSQQIKTCSSLKRIIQHYFGVPIQIKEFVGQWQELITDVRSRLPSKENNQGQNICLGKSVMLGRKGWFAQGKIQITLGPLNKEQFHTFAPGTKALKSLNEMVSTYVGPEQSYDFVILVKRADIPEKIALNSQKQPMIGWNTWLASQSSSLASKDETLKIVVSSSRMK